MLSVHHVKCVFIVVCFLGLVNYSNSKKASDENKPDWAKKDIRDYSEADLERLLDQWEEDEEPLPDDELPEHLRKAEPLDLSNLDTSDPEQLLKMTKKGKTLMMFVSVDGEPDRDETEKLTTLWHGSLFNNHIQCDRFMVDDNRAIFMFKDGSQAWDAKDFLIEQERCKDVTIDSKVYEGKKAAKPKQKAKATVEKVEL